MPANSFHGDGEVLGGARLQMLGGSKHADSNERGQKNEGRKLREKSGCISIELVRDCNYTMCRVCWLLNLLANAGVIAAAGHGL